MKKWKKFIAMGLAVSMIVPSSISQTLWASEFSAENIEIVPDVFDDGADDTEENMFETGETEKQEPEHSEEEEPVNAGQVSEGYTMQLYSDGKLEKTYVIPYADIDTAKAPEALTGKRGYIFKEWNTKEDGTGEIYKPGDYMKELLQIAGTVTQNQEERMETENAETDMQSKEEYDEMNTEDSADTAAAEDKTVVALYAVWEKVSEYKITYKLGKGKNNKSNPQIYTTEDEIKLKKPTRSGYHFVGWYTDSK